MSYRDQYRPIIACILSENKDAPVNVLRKLFRQAFPHGIRKYHPYKVWLDEINKQMKGSMPRPKGRTIKPAPDQGELFQKS